MIERELETTIDNLIGFIKTTSACQTFRKQTSEELYTNTLNALRQKFIQCYNADGQTIDLDSIKVKNSSPIHLYLMRKNEN